MNNKIKVGNNLIITIRGAKIIKDDGINWVVELPLEYEDGVPPKLVLPKNIIDRAGQSA